MANTIMPPKGFVLEKDVNVPINLPEGFILEEEKPKEEKPSSIIQAAGKEIREFGTGVSQLPQSILNVLQTQQKLPPEEASKYGAEILRGVLSEAGKSYLKSYTQPIKSFEERPIATTLDWIPLIGAGAKALKSVPSIVQKVPLVKNVPTGMVNNAAETLAVTTGIEAPITKRWITNPKEVFTKTNLAEDAYSKAGQKLQQIVEEANIEKFKAVKKESSALSGIKGNFKFINTDDYNNINDIIQSRLYKIKGEAEGISPDDLEVINKFRAIASKPMDARTAHKVKLDLDESLSGYYSESEKIIKKPSDVVDKSLNIIRAAINAKLRSLSSGYEKANIEASALIEAEKALKPQLNKISIGKSLKSTLDDPDLRNALEGLAEAMPENKRKWFEDVLNIKAAQESKRLFRKGGGVFSTIGVGGLSSFLTKSPAISAGVALTTSPYFASLGIRGIGKGAQLGTQGISLASKLPIKESALSSALTKIKKGEE